MKDVLVKLMGLQREVKKLEMVQEIKEAKQKRLRVTDMHTLVGLGQEEKPKPKLLDPEDKDVVEV